MRRGGGGCIFEIVGNFGSWEKRKSADMAIAKVGDLLISPDGDFVDFLPVGYGVRRKSFLGQRGELFRYVD